MSKVSFERALGEHAKLLQVAKDLGNIAAGPLAPERAYSTMGIFVARLQDHRSDEANFLYEPLMSYAEECSLEFEAYLSKLLRSAGTDWSAYLRRWTPDQMEAEWATFAFDTRRILDRGRARLRLEEELLYPLARRKGLLSALSS